MNRTKRIIKAFMALEAVDQKYMAELLGIKRATFNMKLNGHLAFTDKEKAAIADLFKSNVIDIFFNTGVDKMSTKLIN